MSQNRNQDDTVRSTTGSTGTSGSTGISGSAGMTGGARGTGGAGTGATDAGTMRDTSMTTTPGSAGSTGGGGGDAAGAAQGITTQAREQAQQVGQKVADAATQARDYVSDKFKTLQNTDYRQVAEDARDYARQKPGQALLVSAAAGFLIGLLIRGGSSRR